MSKLFALIIMTARKALSVAVLSLNMAALARYAQFYLWLVMFAFVTGCAHQSSLISFINSKKPNLVKNAQKELQVTERSFDPDTLYDLLLAELSIQYYQYDTTLTYYKKQALKTRDSGVIQRAWRIANFVGARKTAIEMASLWTEVEPESLMALNALSLEFMLSGRLVDSGEMMLQVLRRGGQSSFELLAMYAEDSSPDERQQLLDVLNKATEINRSNPQLHFAKTILFYQERQMKDALRACNKTLNLKIQGSHAHARVILMKSKILSELKKTTEAKKVLANGLNLYPSAVRMRIQYVKLLLNMGEMLEARFNMELLFMQAFDDPDVLLMIGMLALESDFLNEAGRYLSKLQNYNTHYNVANYHLGRIDVIQGHWKQARSHFMKVGAGRYFLSSRVLLAQTLVENDKLVMLRNDFSSSRKAYPDYASQLFLMEAEVLIEKRKYKQANKILVVAVKYYDKDVGLLYTRAMLSEKMSNFTQTEKDLRKILSIDSNNVAALNALGFSLAYRNERLVEAKKLIVKALKIRPADPAIMDSLGWVEYQMKNYEIALGYLYRAYHATKDVEIAAHLGEVLWVTGQEANAWEVWNEALELEPDHIVLKETLERFQVQQVEQP